MKALQSFLIFVFGLVSSKLMEAQAFSPSLSRHDVVSNFESATKPTNRRWNSSVHVQRGDIGLSSRFMTNKNNILTSSALITVTTLGIPISCSALDLSYLSAATMTATSLVERLTGTGFYQAFSLVFVSEIGDKTFFIAGLLAMKAGKLVSLFGSIGALAVMTIISVLIGQVFHAVPPGISQGIPLDDIAAVMAFAFFGLKTLKDASEIQEGDESGIVEEYAVAEEAVEGSRTMKEITAWGKIISTFGLVFAAEFGDRSFISTIALSAAQNPISVAAGAIAAHVIATGIAVAGGSYVAKYISEKVIGYIGGSLFIVFAVTTAVGVF